MGESLNVAKCFKIVKKILQRNFGLLKIYFSGFLWSNISWPRSPPSSALVTTITVRGALRKITWKSEAVRYKGNITEARRPPFGPGRNFPDRCSLSLAFFPTRVYNIHCIDLYSFLFGTCWFLNIPNGKMLISKYSKWSGEFFQRVSILTLSSPFIGPRTLFTL